jgi:tetratricopeptide (TPR) repeat protein
MIRLLIFAIFIAVVLCKHGVSFGAEGDATSGQQLAKDCGDALNRGDYSQAEECNKKLLLMYPGQKEIYYNLAIAQYYQQKYEEAAGDLYKAIDLGIAVNPQLEMSLRPYKFKKFSLNIGSAYVLKFEGTSNCSEQLITDIMPGLAGLMDGFNNIGLIRPKFMQWGAEGKYLQEEWLVEGKNGDKIFALTLTPTPDGGADFSFQERK